MKHSTPPRLTGLLADLGHRVGILLLFACSAEPAFALPRHAPVPGGIAVLAMTQAQAPIVRFAGRLQPAVQEQGKWFALIGIPLDTVAGQHAASIEDEGKTYRIGFVVRPRHYPTQHLHIADGRMVSPPSEIAGRIVAEQQRLAELRQHYSPQPQPATNFLRPADGRLSARFGIRRVLNGEPRSPHAGLDLALATGRPIRTPAAGTVLAVEDFYFTGRTVIVDHGRGLLTLYAHLSRVDVEVGQTLPPKAPLGLSGASGRATGPHLHWGVFLGGTAVDPELLLPPRR